MKVFEPVPSTAAFYVDYSQVRKFLWWLRLFARRFGPFPLQDLLIVFEDIYDNSIPIHKIKFTETG